ncbi:MAG TPA: MurR/RpiR family transcriptional regulator [Dongiaceae bacterium]|nr:MurR/RpiR family transcriptional regulator [Dongiaceae bacterium]
MRRDRASSQQAIHLQERLKRLTAKRQEILRPVLEHPRGFVLLSVRAMALRLNTDPATVVRIVRALGFESFRDFQKHLHDLSIAFATSADTMQAGGGKSDRGRNSFVADSVDQDIKNLHGLKNTLDAAKLTDLARRMHNARRIVVIAGDLATFLAGYLEYQLSLLGLPVFAALNAGRIGHLIRPLKDEDVVIAISFRRGLRQTVEGLKQARERGAYCVAIADTFLSPLARIAQETFLAGIETTSFAASYAAPVALLNALLAACGQVRKAQTMEIVREISEEQRHGFRWFQE